MTTHRTRAETIVTAVANRLFLPVDYDYKRILRAPTRIMVLAYFSSFIIFSIPPVTSYFIDSNIGPFPIAFVKANTNVWADWTAFASITLEILFLLLIGGTIFGEWVAAHSKEKLEQFQQRIVQAQTQLLVKSSDELSRLIQQYKELLVGITLVNLIVRVWKLYWASRYIFNFLFQDLPKVNARFISAKFSVAFPGGFYGLMAFLIFGLLTYVKVLQLYIDKIADK